MDHKLLYTPPLPPPIPRDAKYFAACGLLAKLSVQINYDNLKLVIDFMKAKDGL